MFIFLVDTLFIVYKNQLSRVSYPCGTPFIVICLPGYQNVKEEVSSSVLSIFSNNRLQELDVLYGTTARE